MLRSSTEGEEALDEGQKQEPLGEFVDCEDERS